MLQLTIEDDGRGIDLRAVARAPRGLGLIAMRERAQALSGGFVIENRGDGGYVRLPVVAAVEPPRSERLRGRRACIGCPVSAPAAVLQSALHGDVRPTVSSVQDWRP